VFTILEAYADFVDYAVFQGKLYDLRYYPGVVESDNYEDKVQGELYRLKNHEILLNILDKYEGCSKDDPLPAEFLRKKLTVTLTNNKKVRAWIYLYNLPSHGLSIIPSGDYLNP
jgi:gamma-glutamylcyclotransferase (GGCT)/AIG2-like uncharacterized protein YtfP